MSLNRALVVFVSGADHANDLSEFVLKVMSIMTSHPKSFAKKMASNWSPVKNSDPFDLACIFGDVK